MGERFFSGKGNFIMKDKLTSKELLFCRLFAESRDARGSAARAGCGVSPSKAAVKLLARADIRREIEAIEALREITASEIREGLRRLAFGSAADAVRLMLSGDELSEEQIEKLDLFNVSEIKRPKGGGLEIKFFDRLKALEKLSEAGGSGEVGVSELLKALDEGAAGISRDLR